MASKQCAKCSEMVDEAKAFCPACGNAFVEEEKRQEASKFEQVERTVQFGQTMYNQMLEDMGLNISSAPNPVEQHVEVLSPISKNIAPKAVVTASTTKEQSSSHPAKPSSSNNLKWYILIGAVVIVLLPVALASAILFVLDIWSRLK